MNHKNLDAWKKSVDLVEHVYDLTKTFPKEEMYCLTQQIRRSAISVPSNIAEGCARKGNRETLQFLYISITSLSELETQFIIAERLNYCSLEEITEKINTVRQLTLGLTKYLKTKI